MATQGLEAARWNSGEHVVRTYPEAASQSFKKGEFVYLASGKVTVCASDATTVLGMAQTDASGTTDTDIEVIIATDRTYFEGNVYHATAASAVTAVTNIGVKYALLSSSNRHYVDIGDTGNDSVTIQQILTGGGKAVGDTYGRVVFKIIDAAQQQDAVAS